MGRARDLPMTPAAPDTPSPAAVTAFLRGIDRRARLFADVQAGDGASARHALAVVARVFASEAGQWPIAEWPRQYWRLLLAAPSMRKLPVASPAARLPGIARLPVEARAAVLLHLVAALDDADAAGALGIGTAAYQARIRDALPLDALGQPDVDVWRAWRAAAQRELERVAEPPPPARPVAESARGDARQPKAKAEPSPSQGSRWLWLGVLACVLAFAAALFIHPAGRETISKWFASIKREALPAAAAPKARFDAGDIALHPDRAQLAAPQEAWYAERLALLAWLANASDPAAADAVPLPIANASEPPRARAAADEAAAIAQRMRQWEALSPRMRGVQRGHWQAWQALEAGERVQLRGIGQRVRQLSGEEQRLLRERFAAQTSDARAGWRLGPRLGRDWPRVAALFGYVDAAERERLLRFLRDAAPEDIDACARLAQSTPPEERAALRAELLAQPAAQRGAWLRARLQ